jgi:hypothetical protein
MERTHVDDVMQCLRSTHGAGNHIELAIALLQPCTLVMPARAAVTVMHCHFSPGRPFNADRLAIHCMFYIRLPAKYSHWMWPH